MTNEKAIEILKKLPNICGQGTAVQMAIKYLENQAKYEKALQLACASIVEIDDCCDEKKCIRDDGDCQACLCEYYKRKAGIEVER